MFLLRFLLLNTVKVEERSLPFALWLGGRQRGKLLSADRGSSAGHQMETGIELSKPDEQTHMDKVWARIQISSTFGRNQICGGGAWSDVYQYEVR